MPVTTIRGGRQITDGTIPYVDIQQVAASRLVGNPTGSAATMSEISLGTGLSFSGSSVVLSANLQSLSGLSYSSAAFVKMTAAGTFALDTATYITGNQTITLSGDVSGSGTTAITTTLATVTQTSGSSFVKINIDGKGRVTGNTAVASGDITTALGYTPYNSTNPNGYTSNTGTVTSVGGTGTVSGLTLTGTVTTSGNLTLGGALSASIDNITDEYRLFNNMGDAHGTRNSFDATSPSYNFGWRYIQGNTNGPGVNSATQYYHLYVGLGNDYLATGAGSYGMQLAIARNVTTPYISIRYNENNGLGSWQKISAGYADTAGNATTVTSITSGQVTTALGYTPYNSTNPNSYITAAQTYYIGTTQNALNRSSAAQTLTGISIDGNAGTATILQTSRSINGTSFNGSANISTTEWYHSDRDFPNGTLITTNINYASTNGDPFVLEIRGNSYGNIIPLDLIYQGYIYDDTIINHGGISNGHSITGLVAINVGGVLCFWFPTQGYWQGYNVKVYIAYATRAINQVTSITSTSKPTSTKEVSLSANIRQSLHSTNYNTYAPTLTGGGASGNWGINVTGYSTQVLSRTVTNVNTQRSAGYLEYYDVENATGAPATGWHSFISVRHGNPSNEYGFQFANAFDSDTLYWRGWDGTNPKAWRTIVHSGNIGSFETDTLATVMTRGASSSTFMTLTGGGLFSGNEYTFRSNIGDGNYLGSTTTVRLQAYSNDGGAAFMTFHRGGSWAVNMGLDPDNVFRIGGFSATANRLQLNMSGDLTVAGSVNSTTNITVGTDIYLTNLTSPNTSTIRFGDNTGWTFRFQTSVSNTWTTRFSFGDNGTFTAVGDVIAYSDARVKTNVVTIKDSLEKVQKLRGVTYNRTDSTDDAEKIGVIAQEVQKVLPQVVTKDKDGMLGVSYGNLAGVFIEAIKEQQTQIEDLKKQIQYLVENR